MLDNITQCIKTSISSLLANKARSFLTMLGIIIGVGAVIVIMAVGAGAQSLIIAQVKTLGTNLIGIMPGKAENGPPTSAMGIVITTLTEDDIDALKKSHNVPDLEAVVGCSKGIAALSWESAKYDTNLSGCTADYIDVEGGAVAEGRFYTEEEDAQMAKVAVLGSTVKRELFGDSEAVGRKIKIKKHAFDVIGVMEERGTVALQDYDDQILMPLKTAQKLVLGVNHLGLIRLKIDNEDNTQKAIADIEATLRESHNIADLSGESDDFTVRSAAQALDMITTITDALKYFLAAMAALSLLVGGIGIMNIMLVSVTERTREIGLRKAVGATIGNITSQFLTEAVAITLLGGIIGIIGGAIVSYAIAVGANMLGYDWDFVVSLVSVSLAVTVSSAVGLVFGLYPARKASRLEPVEALRYE